MKLEEYTNFDATALGQMVRNGEVTAAELTGLARQAHDLVNPVINAMPEFYADAETVPGSDTGCFAGAPFLRKDLGSAEKGRLQENGSRLFKGYIATEDSTYIERARAAGLRVVGRSNIPEFATSGFTETFLHGITGNPWNLDRSSGGSSGGASAAVAAGIVPMAHASDGGGSIRIPAGWCGLVGLNPSRGRISMGPAFQDALYGLAREFVVCRTVRDMANALDAFSGPAPGDPFVIVQPERPFADELDRPTPKARIAVATTPWGSTEMDPEVRTALEQTVATLKGMGHSIEEIACPVNIELVRRAVMGAFTWALVGLDKAARDMGREIGPDTMEPVSLKLYELAKGESAAWAADVMESMRELRHTFGVATADYDLIVTPTMPVAALPHGTYSTTRDDLSALAYQEGDTSVFQYLGIFNATGQPSVTLPLAQSSDGLPIGIQIAAPFGDEAALVRISRDLEQACPWSGRRPPVHATSI